VRDIESMSALVAIASCLAAITFILASLMLTMDETGGQAATFTVSSTVDAVDANPGDGVCETDGGTGVCTLRAAIQESNAFPGEDRISLPAGTYILSIEGLFEDAAATGDLDITGALEISGAGSSEVTVTENTFCIERLFDVHPSASVRFSGLTIGPSDLCQTGPLDPHDCGKGIRNASELVLDDLLISGNEMRGNGGGICNLGILWLSRSTLRGNVAAFSGAGGGLFNRGSASVRDVTISANEAQVLDGGGIFNEGALTLSNVTISENRTHDFPLGSRLGGGLANVGTADLTNATFTRNFSAVAGGGLFNSDASSGLPTGTLRLVNSLVANNPGGDCLGLTISAGHNLDSDGSCTLSSIGDLPNTDPMLDSLGDNGGLTQTHALLAGSPAIDAGDNSSCLATDQRGAPRPADGDLDGNADCDIGAYEVEGPVPTTTSPTPSSPAPSPSPSQTSAPAPTPEAALPLRLPSTGGGRGRASIREGPGVNCNGFLE
jgi:CSLREA domain-containing protein